MSEFKKIVFFNGHQNGDIANNRGVVSYITKHLGDRYEYFYLHNRNPDAILFGENIKVFNPEPYYGKQFQYPTLGDIKMSHVFRKNYVIDDMIFLNLWIGISEYYLSHRAPKGHGITRKSLMEQTIECIEYLKQTDGVEIPYPTSELETLPRRLEYPLNKQLVDSFVQKVKPNYRKLVLIPNGQVESGQTPQFNFGDELKPLIDTNQDVCFIFTAKNFQNQNSNVYFVDDQFPIPNLTEIDYLSKDCNVLITRASGPGCIVSTLDNYLDISKTFISFTNNHCISFEALSSDGEIEKMSWGNENTAKMIWSNDFSSENICKIIGDAIK
jgi:hypothetical protein